MHGATIRIIKVIFSTKSKLRKSIALFFFKEDFSGLPRLSLLTEQYKMMATQRWWNDTEVNLN
jgi:hypothetical protein